uniref:Uncharacterized protein n=1 Tax=Arion vulgaris TaxID=1028688 RepID=A0A0B6ZT62_9EUPU
MILSLHMGWGHLDTDITETSPNHTKNNMLTDSGLVTNTISLEKYTQLIVLHSYTS